MAKWYAGMTEDAIRARVVETARQMLGIKENTTGHKDLVTRYNAQGNLPRGYALKTTDAWCAAFVSVVGIMLGISDIILPECSCGHMIALYKQAGSWIEDDGYVPKPGDLIMYDWDATKGECIGAPDHVGMVESVSGNTITVIEGNYDNQVKRRDICVEYIKVRGYCLPNYAGLVQRFSDVDPDAWYADAINRAAQLGIVQGVGGGKFEPDRAVTRAEVVAMCVRLCEKLGK